MVMVGNDVIWQNNRSYGEYSYKEREENKGMDDGGGKRKYRVQERGGNFICHDEPSFHGRSDPEACLKWMERMELIFYYHDYSKRAKVRIVVSSFIGYAIEWWEKVLHKRKKRREGTIEVWAQLKDLMVAKFVPTHYDKGLYLGPMCCGNRLFGEAHQVEHRTYEKQEIGYNTCSYRNVCLSSFEEKLKPEPYFAWERRVD